MKQRDLRWPTNARDAALSLEPVGASLAVMEGDTCRMRGERPFVFANRRSGEGVDTVVKFIERSGGLEY